MLNEPQRSLASTPLHELIWLVPGFASLDIFLIPAASVFPRQNQLLVIVCVNSCVCGSYFPQTFPSYSFIGNRGWSGGAMVLGKLPVPGRQKSRVGLVWTFFSLSSITYLFFVPLSGRRPSTD